MHLSIRDKSNFSRHQEHLLSLPNLQAALHRTGKQVNVCKVCWSGKSNSKYLIESETVERREALHFKQRILPGMKVFEDVHLYIWN